MKKNSTQMLSALWIVCVSLISLITGLSCQEGNGQTGGKTPVIMKSYADTIEAAKKWFRLNELADAYVAQVKNKYLTIPLNEKAGNVYMKAYRHLTSSDREPVRTLAAIISDTSLAFYVRYLVEHPEYRHVQASFGQYDLNALRQANARDVLLEHNTIKDYRKTLVFGIPFYPRKPYDPSRPNDPEYYTQPFKVGDSSFYDNWHEIWP